MDYMSRSLEKHEQWCGKVEVVSRVAIESAEDLSLAYTPGVASPCLEIAKNPDLSYVYTRRSNMIAVVTDGSAVLGLGDIGAVAAMPVMEGKCALFKAFADVDAFPLCIASNDVDEIVNTVRLLSGSFGGINLEDISAPRCFEIERRLKQVCDIPIFHDDQHGTAVVVLAAMINAARFTKREMNGLRVVINGAGAAGTAVAALLRQSGVLDITMCDREGIVGGSGSLSDAVNGADVLIGLSAANCVTFDMVKSMNRDAIVFPLANPVPEIMPDLAKSAGAAIVGTGRSDFPNQINNVLAFPGIFRGALDVRARDINDEMKVAAAYAIADYIPESELRADCIIPSVLDRGVSEAVASAVKNFSKST
ncbi:MAG: NADP-dependent malic enzyme [Oscillospiraceae bacterium]|nr:NADP-dependent malic enzyme [Oscillospiraceae bacterium]